MEGCSCRSLSTKTGVQPSFTSNFHSASLLTVSKALVESTKTWPRERSCSFISQQAVLPKISYSLCLDLHRNQLETRKNGGTDTFFKTIQVWRTISQQLPEKIFCGNLHKVTFFFFFIQRNHYSVNPILWNRLIVLSRQDGI